MSRLAILSILSLLTAVPSGALSNKELERQIVELRHLIELQNERIGRLEALVEAAPISQRKQVFSAKFPWHKSSSWDKIKAGMSRSQVLSILGKPIETKTDVISYVTLYYRGEIGGSGFVSGNVVLNADDRVIFINHPVF